MILIKNKFLGKMVLVNEIKTVLKYSNTEFKEKGSRFIGQIYHVENEEEVTSILDEIKKNHYNATHHCYAYRFMNNEFKYSDDGEPNGTAGIRIFNALQHFELVNNIIVVIRYYGGTKLGVGPLGKAYYKSAHETIEKSNISTLENFSKMKISYDYDFSSQVHYLLNQFNCQIQENKFDKMPCITFLIKMSLIDEMKQKLKELSSGKYESTIETENIFR